MSDYEFWKELGKIFNAVVSYQEKSIEFNKRFINPWIKIGNVFDQQDHQQEEVRAYTQAAEIDPFNAQCWIDLGNAHYRNQSYDDAVIAFQKAIELNPNMGWSYSNLAVIYAEQNKHLEAKALYEKSIQLLNDDREKAISWNRLGNLHRKLNEYELAIQAFQKADELDRENTGFKDVIGETLAQSKSQTDDPVQIDPIATSIQLIVAQSQSEEDARDSLESPASVQTENVLLAAEPLVQPEPTFAEETVASMIPEGVSTLESIGETVSQVETTPALYVEVGATRAPMETPVPTDTETLSHLDETYSEEMAPDQQAEAKTIDSNSAVSMVQETIATPLPAKESPQEANVDIQNVEPSESVTPVANKELTAEIVLDGNSSDVVTEPTESISIVEESIAKTVEVAVPDEIVMESADPATVISTEEIVLEIVEPTSLVDVIAEAASETAVGANVLEDDTEAADHDVAAVTEEPVAEIAEVTKLVGAIAETVESIDALALEAPVVAEESVEFANPSEAAAKAAEPKAYAEAEISAPEVARETDPSETTIGVGQLAYDEFLKDENQRHASIAVQVSPELPEQETAVQRKPMALIDESGDFKLEMDAKNAHVWNELGNVYFNKGAVEDAVIAYSKAIELDRLFAWPYSNLALAYVQKGRFAEAMLLYQRSIELFTKDKDKAISWNRLGNVYRRLNDYDNAIAAYQRADELDPDNSTIYLQSRFSLLGSIQLNQNANVDS